jgi:hypothetical protein
MKTLNPSYIIADIPESVFSDVMALRRSCCGRSDDVPAEITLAGSSGVGPIPVGTDISLVTRIVESLLHDMPAFEVSFSGWKVFPNTTIAYLEPKCRLIFDVLHNRLAGSGIPFSPIAFPYNPHCTIGSSWSSEALSSIHEIPFPKDSFMISSVRFLDLNNTTLKCNELARFSLV